MYITFIQLNLYDTIIERGSSLVQYSFKIDYNHVN